MSVPSFPPPFILPAIHLLLSVFHEFWHRASLKPMILSQWQMLKLYFAWLLHFGYHFNIYFVLRNAYHFFSILYFTSLFIFFIFSFFCFHFSYIFSQCLSELWNWLWPAYHSHIPHKTYSKKRIAHALLYATVLCTEYTTI